MLDGSPMNDLTVRTGAGFGGKSAQKNHVSSSDTRGGCRGARQGDVDVATTVPFRSIWVSRARGIAGANGERCGRFAGKLKEIVLCANIGRRIRHSLHGVCPATPATTTPPPPFA